MNTGNIITISVAAVGVVGGYFANDKQINNKIEETKSKTEARINNFPEKYVLKIDYREDINEIKTTLKDIKKEQFETNKLLFDSLKK